MQYFHGIINLQRDASLVLLIFGGGCERGGRVLNDFSWNI